MPRNNLNPTCKIEHHFEASHRNEDRKQEIELKKGRHSKREKKKEKLREREREESERER